MAVAAGTEQAVGQTWNSPSQSMYYPPSGPYAWGYAPGPGYGYGAGYGYAPGYAYGYGAAPTYGPNWGAPGQPVYGPTTQPAPVEGRAAFVGDGYNYGSPGYYRGYGYYPDAPNYPYIPSGGNSGGANFPHSGT